MNFIKKKLIYNVSKNSDWAYSHCHKPTPLIINDYKIRVYFGVRDTKGKTRTTFVDVDTTNLDNFKVIYEHAKPVLDLGELGTFDDSGVNVSSLIRIKDLIYMYYIGWNPSITVSTRNSIGIAESTDGGKTFKRLYKGPILDRNKNEPFYTGAVDVLRVNDKWMMWYTSGSKWKIINNKPEISYHIKYAESSNGIDWKREGIDCIYPKSELEVCARPCVLYENKTFKMFYSKRKINNFRTNFSRNYRGGFAVSQDGKTWKRLDRLFNLKPSKGGWDSMAIAYPYVFKLRNKYVMLYNGKGFGETGFGYAVADSI